MKLKYFIPLIAFFIPTWIITYFRWPEVFVQYPKQNIESLIGMLIMWFFMGLNYYLGIKSVLKDKE
jgi:amino acid transporter